LKKLFPRQVYIEVFGEWFLNHRSEEELTELAVLAGAELEKIRIDHEPLLVNLFLRLIK
jgi:extracellular factor (EF) 3-hydroxypalmitic acid methyl ester biosynthesis protein